MRKICFDAPPAQATGSASNTDTKPYIQKLLCVFAALIAGLIASPAWAVPSFADQTGQPCQACHVGGIGPQLTEFGREFKLGGYTLRTKKSIPLAAMAIASVTHTSKDQVPPPDHFSENNNVALDQISVFLAGGAGKHLGAFVQVTYDGVGRHFAWDNLDLRAVTTGHVFGKDAVFGLDVNNSPNVQDAWNTTAAWGFPYTDTAVSGTPGAAPLIDEGLAQSTIGVTAYTWIDQKFYLEGGVYTSPSEGTLNWLGSDPLAPGNIDGVAPYGRVAFQTDVGGGKLELGAFALKANIIPERDDTSGFSDHYTDWGLDASWQKAIGTNDNLAANFRYVHESLDLQASCDLGLLGEGGVTDCARTSLNEFRGNVSYYWHNKIGLTLGGFSISGPDNADLYGPTQSPDSDGLNLQVDYTPWGDGTSPLGPLFNVRFGLQYTAYLKFDGAKNNYDGAGANASDNNALRFFTWIAF
jgi:hypothetical protein